MSNWTKVRGVIDVCPAGNSQAEKRYTLETLISHLPKITGSEKDVNIYIIQKSGNDYSASFDEFYYPINNEVQSHYLIVLDGNLRDRIFDFTLKETNIFLNKLSKNIWIDDILLKIKGQGSEYVYKNAEPYKDNFECLYMGLLDTETRKPKKIKFEEERNKNENK